MPGLGFSVADMPTLCYTGNHHRNSEIGGTYTHIFNHIVHITGEDRADLPLPNPFYREQLRDIRKKEKTLSSHWMARVTSMSMALTLIPTAVTIYGSHYVKAKFLKKSLNNINLKKNS
jgi:hypothetical protein